MPVNTDEWLSFGHSFLFSYDHVTNSSEMAWTRRQHCHASFSHWTEKLGQSAAVSTMQQLICEVVGAFELDK